MRNKKLKLFLGIVVALCGIAAIFGLFGNAFGDVNNIPDARGSVFNLMFHASEAGYNDMPLLGTAFGLLIAGSCFALIGAFLPGKIGGIALGITTALLLGGSIILLNTKGIFLNAGTIKGSPIYDADSLSLGLGAILPAVFGIGGSVLGLYGAYTGFKA